MEDTLDLVLLKPVTLGNSTTYDVLRLTEPTLGQLIESEKAGSVLEQMAALVALNAKVSTEVVRRLCQRDAQAAVDFFRRFERPTTPPLDTGSLVSAGSTAGPVQTPT